MSAERALYPDERPTVPAAESDEERSFEALVAACGGSWSEKMRVVKPIDFGEEPSE